MSTPEWLSRTELLLGESKLSILQKSHVLVVGLGGVGAYAAEMLCRAGVGKLSIIDGDCIETSNINRQLIALRSTEGKSKAHLMADRLRDINPDIELIVIDKYIHGDTITEVLDGEFDYVVDAIDTLVPKIFLIYHSVTKGLKIASSMGSGGKHDPTQIQITDISKSYNCKLAAILRKRLHRLGVYSGVKVVFSPEKINKEAVILTEGEQNKKSNVGTISYMPPAFGCFLASIVINDLLENKESG
ncbi:MAG: tRNA threonylcarbamoyladenosine dehydratase [Bacteroidetes bacterium]|jgi:tRNA threonylcarbamoyladenosine dehydratase|nr:tRNA threonylcarbamoyladenosine dehydratase [Bacteroidota bacterium]MBT4401079.1 tRNA threonylcarbamoyladenosine dehydratase [Bacteroidota bacterium]MBT4408639.1 tRNA threonylcarbamoyladenosine dehydratase [Bacteroidota bacterium]MBT7092233.1 tRNA threonylcarbamoyladenosine dehydratase [Bacteroidota bacterium]